MVKINTFNTCNGTHIFEFYLILLFHYFKRHCAGAILLKQFAWELLKVKGKEDM